MESLVAALHVPGASVWLVVSYLLGSIPFGLLIALGLGKTDVRTKGSGNIGATNVARVVGKKLGAFTLLLDGLKGAAPVLLVDVALEIPPESGSLLASLSGLMALIGHCFPVWLRFHGGKGVATGAGFFVAHLPLEAGIGLAAFALVYAVSRTVSLASLLAGLVAVVTVAVRGPHDVSLAPVGVMFLIMVLRHTSNIKRLLRKEELKV
ncbi:MAG: glycerol-3-phosphate 1-O-acyltransferase PlsY [Myxococcota bacterium]